MILELQKDKTNQKSVYRTAQLNNCFKFTYIIYYKSVLRPETVAQVAERPSIANRHVGTVAARHVPQRVGLIREACVYRKIQKSNLFFLRRH